MDREEIIVLAVAAGAAARMEPNNRAQNRTEVLAYLDLVERLERAHRGVNGRMMEIAPGSKERQQLLADQIGQSGAADDRLALKLSRRVLQEVMARTPQAFVAIFADEPAIEKALSTVETILEAE